MDLACTLCGSPVSPDPDAIAQGKARCGTCGSQVTLPPPGDGPRAELETIPLDSGSLRRLTRESRLDADVDALLDAEPASPVPSAPRAPAATIPFELVDRAARPEPARPVQPSVAFDLTREAPVPLARPPQPSVAFELTSRPAGEAPDAPIELRSRRAPLGVVIVLVLALVLAVTLVFGRF